MNAFDRVARKSFLESGKCLYRKMSLAGATRVFLACAFFLLFFPQNSHALPTPDALLSLVNIVPLVTGALVTAGSGVIYALRNFLGDDLKKLLPLVFVVLLIIGALLGHSRFQQQKAERIRNIAMYLRCDPAAHERGAARHKSKTITAPSMWLRYGNFKNITMDEVSDNLSQRPDATLIDATEMAIKYHAGIPTVNLGDHLLPFEHVRPMELANRLKNDRAKDLYLYDFGYIKYPPELYPESKAYFSKYENIFLVHRVRLRHLYVYNDSGELRAVHLKTGTIEWPVEREKWLYDEERINFPNIVKLLSDKDAAKLIKQKDIFFIAPYANSRRSKEVYEGLYLRKLLHNIERKRILPIDLNLPDTSQRIRQIREKIDGHKFIVVGLSKMDWVYDGLDLAFELWEQMEHNTDRFKLLGFTTRLPEVVAINWEKNSRKGVIDSLYKPFWQFITRLHEKMGWSDGVLIFTIALLLRLLFSPVGYLETRSRIRRKSIQKILGGTKKPSWRGSGKALMHHLKVRPLWEFVGAAMLLILIMPAYRILAHPPKGHEAAGFLWVDSLIQPDWLLSVLVGLLILTKMNMDSFSIKKFGISFLVTLAFVVLLDHLPSSLLVYLFAVLLVTVSQDLVSIKRSRGKLCRALLVAK